jgi:hypothetical protein
LCFTGEEALKGIIGRSVICSARRAERDTPDLVKAFRSTFQPSDSFHAFHNSLDDMVGGRVPKNPYCNLLPVLQSLGFEKSRMVDETAKYRVALSLTCGTMRVTVALVSPPENLPLLPTDAPISVPASRLPRTPGIF